MAMLEPCWRYVGSFFALGRLFFAFGRFWDISLAFSGRHGRFFYTLACSGVDFGGFGKAAGRFWKLQNRIFRSFFVRVATSCGKAPHVQKPQFLLGFY